MRNDYIGTSIDGDHAACCHRHHNGSTPCGCEKRPSRSGSCGCGSRTDRSSCCEQQTRQLCSSECESPCSTHATRSDCDCDRGHDRERSCSQNSCAERCSGNTPGMVYAAHHDLDNMYCAERALLRGTLFGCLDKPMCNEYCTDNPCTTQCQEDQFSIWELRLYLNTHPHDQKALALLRKLIQQMDEDCTCAFSSDCNRWSWIDGPWPWEYQRCCGKEA